MSPPGPFSKGSNYLASLGDFAGGARLAQHLEAGYCVKNLLLQHPTHPPPDPSPHTPCRKQETGSLLGNQAPSLQAC